MATHPDAGAPITPIAAPLQINGSTASGQAIAFAQQGRMLMYLVVSTDQGPPVWVADTDVESSHLKR